MATYNHVILEASWIASHHALLAMTLGLVQRFLLTEVVRIPRNAQ